MLCDRSRRCGGPRRITLPRLVTLTSSGPSPSLTGPSVRCVSAFLPPSLTQPTERPLHTHQKRLPRASTTQDSSRLNQKIFHLPDGPARDEVMRTVMASELEGKPLRNPGQWADRTKGRIQLATTRTRRSSGGGRPADVGVSRRSLALAIVGLTEALPG